jgi:hypothetical protein
VGDINCDFGVDILDLAELANQWLQGCEEPSWCGGTDFDYSGVVDLIDFASFAKNWLVGVTP